MSCAHAPTCPLFRVFTMHSALRIWQTNYCEDGFDRCERHRAAEAGQRVPPNLLPNGKLLAIPVSPRKCG